MTQQQNISVRWGILAAGVAAMLFAGTLYAWSILKLPFAEELCYAPSALALCFTLAMCFFCLGGFLAGQLVRRIGVRPVLLAAGVLAGLGYVLTSRLGAGNALLLYLTYSLLAGLGIGMAYIVIISTVNAWFPDRRGLSSGALMMGFGASTLLLGNLADKLFQSALGWRGTYVAFGVAIAAVVMLSSLVIKAPGADAALPQKKAKAEKSEAFEARDYTPTEMLRRFTFWRAFLALVCLSAVGNSVISFARDLALSVGAGAALATTLVGVLAVCNGLGRIITGAVFDALGRRFTMIAAGVLTVVAAGVTLLAVGIGSLPLCIIGLCLTGLSYGTSPTVSSAFTSAFYGQAHFAANLSISNFNLMAASFVATACTSLQTASGSFTAPFVLLLSLAAAALVLNISIKKP